jgi:hypothetical protein
MLEKQHGERAPEVIHDRVKALAEAGDSAGVQRWLEIADWFDRLQRPAGPVN